MCPFCLCFVRACVYVMVVGGGWVLGVGRCVSIQPDGQLLSSAACLSSFMLYVFSHCESDLIFIAIYDVSRQWST